MNWLTPLKQRLKRKHQPNPFTIKLLAQAKCAVDGAQALINYLVEPTKQHVLCLRTIENQADEERRALIMQINRTFVTPIDREDLHGLSRAIDDILDRMYSATREMYLLKVAPNDHLKLMAGLLYESAQEIYLAIEYLEKHPDIAGKHTMRVLALENRMENLYIEALADSFKNPTSLDSIVDMLKLREIYRHMDHAVSSTERTANLINDILVKFF